MHIEVAPLEHVEDYASGDTLSLLYSELCQGISLLRRRPCGDTSLSPTSNPMSADPKHGALFPTVAGST